MKHLNIDQQIRLALWPLLTIIFINTFGMLWFALSGAADALSTNSFLVVSFDGVFRITLLIISFIIGAFVYDQQKKRMEKEFVKGHYNMRGKGAVGFVMHTILGLVEATFAFFTLNIFWLIVNFSADQIPLIMDYVFWIGFGMNILIAAYLLTRQVGLGVLASRRRP